MAQGVADAGIVMLDPSGSPEAALARRAPRLDTLDGKTIGLLHNAKKNSDKVLDLVAAVLARQYRFSVVRMGKDSASRAADPEIIAGLKRECDAVITGVGD